MCDVVFFFFQAEDGIRDLTVTGVQTCALPIFPGAHTSEKAELIAVASRDQRRAEEYAREWEIDRAYGSYEALLEDGEVEAVYISLPNALHCEWSIRALEAGKNRLFGKTEEKDGGARATAFHAAAEERRSPVEAVTER